MLSRSLGHRAPLLWLLLPWALGLTLSQLATTPLPVGTLLAAAGLALSGAAFASWRQNSRGWATGLVLGVILSGIAAQELRRARLAAWDTLPVREARLELEVLRPFATPKGQTWGGGLGRVVGTDPHLRDLVGQRVSFSVGLRDEPGLTLTRGMQVNALGVLTALPKHPEPGSFDRYLADQGVNFKFNRARLHLAPPPVSGYRGFCERWRVRFETALGRGLETKRPEIAAVLRAMLLGQKASLDPEQRTLFMQSGTMHLFAISGLHIGVIALAIESVLLLLRLPAAWRFLLGTAALWLYVDITGAPPSAVRAFIMITFLHASWRWRVPGNPLAALVASAFTVLLIDPFQLFTASFQMSYAIVASLLLFSVPLADRAHQKWALHQGLPEVSWSPWQRFSASAWRWVLTLVFLGLGSALVSQMSGVEFFGLFTPGSFFANLLLIPLAGLALSGGFVSLLSELVGWAGGSGFFNHAAAVVLVLMQTIVQLAVSVPGSHFPASFATPWIWPLALALLLLTLGHGYVRHWEGRLASPWLPFALVASTLVLGLRFL